MPGRACVGSRHLLFAKALYSVSTLVLISTLSVGKDAGGETEREGRHAKEVRASVCVWLMDVWTCVSPSRQTEKCEQP